MWEGKFRYSEDLGTNFFIYFIFNDECEITFLQIAKKNAIQFGFSLLLNIDQLHHVGYVFGVGIGLQL